MNAAVRSIVAPLLVLAGAQHVPAVQAAQPPPVCSVQAPGYDSREISCTIRSAGSPQRFRLQARFSGGHDDTSANLKAFVDEQPVACDDGSKTSLMGEDGDVSLACRFSVHEAAGVTRVMKTVVRWSHAEYTGFELTADE